MDHTKEPWRVWNHGGDFAIEALVLEPGIYGDLSTSLSEANASRIVACVNACAGMEDPEGDIFLLREGNRLKAEVIEQEYLPELSSLRSALAEKTTHVERLRETLTNIHDYGIDRDGETTSEKLGELVDELVQLAREALAATAPDVTK